MFHFALIAYPTGAASPSIQNSLASGSIPSTISPNSAFSPKLPEAKPVISSQQVSQLVRKELEKSLAQIEFPKPPAQDIYFIPNTNSSDFLYCLGLEEVAKCVQEHLIHKQLKAETKEQKENGETSKENALTKADTITEVVYEYPLFCAQCSTDFSPVWRTDKNGVNLCERCLKQLEKKQIKTEHNARLKQAFLKAVKDKEVFEKQLLAEQQKALELQRQQRAAAQAQAQERAATMAAERAAAAAAAAAERVSVAAAQQAQRERDQAAMASQNNHHSQQRMSSSSGNSQNRGPGHVNTNANRMSSGGAQNPNMSRQQQQQMQQRRSMPGGMNQKSGMNHGQQAKPGMNNVSSSVHKSGNSVGRPMNNTGRFLCHVF